MPLILEEDLQKLKSALSIIFSVINNVAADKDEVQRARAITYGNDLTAPKENSQMLIDVKGACIKCILTYNFSFVNRFEKNLFKISKNNAPCHSVKENSIHNSSRPPNASWNTVHKNM